MTPFTALQQNDAVILLAALAAAALWAVLRACKRSRTRAEATEFKQWALRHAEHRIATYEDPGEQKTDAHIGRTTCFPVCGGPNHDRAALALMDRYVHHYKPQTAFVNLYIDGKSRTIPIEGNVYSQTHDDLLLVSLRPDRQATEFLYDATSLEIPPENVDHIYVTLCGKEFWFVNRKKKRNNQ